MNEVPGYLPAPKKSKTGLIVGLVLGGIVLCCILPLGLIGGLGYFGFKKSRDLIVCAQAFDTVRESVLDYAKEHKGKLPKADTWMDDVRPYYAKRAQTETGQQNPFGVMSSDGPYSCTTDDKKTGMAFNKSLSGKKIGDIADQSTTVLLFETESPAPNLSEEYVRRSRDSSPKMFGKHRDWFTVTLEGKPHAGRAAIGTNLESGSGVNVTTTIDPEPFKETPKKKTATEKESSGD